QISTLSPTLRKVNSLNDKLRSRNNLVPPSYVNGPSAAASAPEAATSLAWALIFLSACFMNASSCAISFKVWSMSTRSPYRSLFHAAFVVDVVAASVGAAAAGTINDNARALAERMETHLLLTMLFLPLSSCQNFIAE